MSTGLGKIVHAEGSVLVTGHVASETLSRLFEEKKEEIRKRFPHFFIENMLKRLEADGLAHAPEPGRSAEERLAALTQDTTVRKQYGILAVRPIGDEGFFSALWHSLEEIGAGCEVWLERVPVYQETIEICDLFDINPFEAPSGGCGIITCRRGAELAWFLESQGVGSAPVGVILPPPARRIEEGDHTRFLDRPR